MAPSDGCRERVADYFRRKPAAMTLMAAQDLGVPELEVIRALESDGNGGATELKPESLEAILQEMAGWGHCHVIVSNRGATLEAYGELGGFSRSGPFLNVETKTLAMHLRPAALAAIFCVDKRGHMDGQPIHTVQCYDAEGGSILKVVMMRHGETKRYASEQDAAYEAFRERHRKTPSPVKP